jgi:hypothetical protein
LEIDVIAQELCEAWVIWCVGEELGQGVGHGDGDDLFRRIDSRPDGPVP